MHVFDRQMDGQTDRKVTATARSNRVRCALKTNTQYTHDNINEPRHSEMDPVRQKPILRPVTCSINCATTKCHIIL